ncbi:MAG TPA: hypothetical protein VHM90_05015 [Phycisphaerae bacterium]|jgi:hypothetical protein|nr:hypothetical protein [Phycisphaerae bacterium]
MALVSSNRATDAATICRRCSALLTPGKGDFYTVAIQAYAENSPPVITAEDLARDHRQEMHTLVEQMKDLSEQEMMDQVYRHMTFFLCAACYQHWIENPTG